MPRKAKPKQHFPTPEERDERHKIEDVRPEDALKILLGAGDDRELDDRNSEGPGDALPR
jgi:hypothetical protein